ncbi:hypothetical protein ACWKW9_16965 [Rhizobium daejeonense]
MKRIIVTNSGPESRTSQIDREIEGLISGFVDAPSKKVSDSLFYLTRERAMLLRKKRKTSDSDTEKSRFSRGRKLNIAM